MGSWIAGCETTLVSVIPPASLRILPDQVTVLEGEEEIVEADLRGPAGEPLSGRTVVWRSDNPDVASVTPSGIVRGEREGLTIVRAQVESLQASVPIIVLKGPTIALSAGVLKLEGPSREETPLEIAVLVENAGNGAISALSAFVQFEGDSGQDWLNATLQGTSAPTTLLVQAFLADLAPGDYRATVRVSDPSALNSPQLLEVELRVGEPLPEIGLSPTVVALGAAAGTFQPATEDVAVQNTGGGVLDGLVANVTYLSGGAAGWLSAAFADEEAPTTMELSASARFLAPGTYVAEVEVTSTSVPSTRGTVRVTFTVQ